MSATQNISVQRTGRASWLDNKANAQSLPGIFGDESQTLARARLMLLSHLLVLVATLVLLSAGPVFHAGPDIVVSATSSMLLLVFAWMMGSWMFVRKTLFDLYGMFIVMAFLFHGSYAILRLIGRTDAIYLLPEIHTRLLAESLGVVLVGLAALHLGALWAMSVQPRRHDRTTTRGKALGPAAEDEITNRSGSSPYWLGIGILLVAVGLPAMVIKARHGIDLVAVGGYRELFTNMSDSGALSMLGNIARDFLFTGACFLMIAGKRFRVALPVSLCLIAFISGYYLYLGQRAYAILPVIAAVWLWHNAVRPLPLRLMMIPAGLVVLYLMPIVRIVRGSAGGGRLSWEQLGDAALSVPDAFIALLGEAGGTLMTVAYSIELTPSVRPFEFGSTYLGAVANAIPMLGWPLPYGHGSQWLATTIKLEWAANGFGFGYSFLAEAYLNFGWFGVPLVAVAVGFLLASLIRWARRDPARQVVLAVFIPIVLFYVRGESIDVIRPLVWRALLPYLTLVLLLHVSSIGSARRGVAGGVRRPSRNLIKPVTSRSSPSRTSSRDEERG